MVLRFESRASCSLPTDKALIDIMARLLQGFMLIIFFLMLFLFFQTSGAFGAGENSLRAVHKRDGSAEAGSVELDAESLQFLAMSIGSIPTNLMLLPTQITKCCSKNGKRVMQPRAKLQRLWLTIRSMFVMMATVMIAFQVWRNQQNHHDDETEAGFFISSGSFILCAILGHPRVRGRAIRALGSLGSGGGGEASEQAQAASIAALVGGKDAVAAISTAASRFRVLPIANLDESDLTSSTDTGLNLKTNPAALGECDAFMSHSWADDGVAKFKCLHEWASEAAAKTIWLDKACIDQNDIDASLAGLPIFLSGCSKLLVLAGPSYASRLWCVMEVYTFVKMGGLSENMAVKPLGGAEIQGALARFDAKQARCFHDKDRHKLLAVIESGFGDLAPFNAVARGLLTGKKS